MQRDTTWNNESEMTAVVETATKNAGAFYGVKRTVFLMEGEVAGNERASTITHK